jgi:predicted GH43/DUF377 family glycosyl hydrolase
VTQGSRATRVKVRASCKTLWHHLDPRITYLPYAKVYVMAYTALGLLGPHVALASSRDLRTWRRHGPVDFAPERDTDFNVYANKDALLLPEPCSAPAGSSPWPWP